MTSTRASGLAGKRILIVEDEFYLADDLARAIQKCGAEVVGPVGSLRDAQEVLEDTRIDSAILDFNLKGEMAFPIADRLQTDGIPFVIASGYTGAAIPDRFKSAPHIEKPFDTAAVLQSIDQLLRTAGAIPAALE
jgi:DNA-binding response OmpR family regulator